MRPLLIENGQPTFGIFKEGVSRVNYGDFVPYSTMDRPRGALSRRFGANQFHFVGLLSEKLVMGIAVVDLKLVGNGFAYAYEPETKRLQEWSVLQPLARKTAIPDTPNAGVSRFAGQKMQVVIEALPGGRRVDLRIGQDLHLEARLMAAETFDPLCISTRAGYSGWVYTQKAAGLRVEGSLRMGDREIDLAEAGVYGGYDWTAGFMRRDTCWNWSSISAELSDGRRLGLNLAAGVNETGFTENGFWVDDVFTKVDSVAFDFNRLKPLEPWTMTSYDGRVTLRFEPEGLRKERLNFAVMASNFKQLFGRYEGELRLESGEVVRLENTYGFAEDHYARW